MKIPLLFTLMVSVVMTYAALSIAGETTLGKPLILRPQTGPSDEVTNRGLRPQPEPPGTPADAVGLRPQPEPPGKPVEGVTNRGLRPQPEPPGTPSDGVSLRPQPEPPGMQ